jgi:hypothetical protein
MGMDQTVAFPGATPSWPVVAAALADRGVPIKVQMIDGELAFPDETPSEGWRELRLGAPGGTVTVRRSAGRVQCIVWGNADAVLRQSWDAVAEAFAAAGQGSVTPAEGH